MNIKVAPSSHTKQSAERAGVFRERLSETVGFDLPEVLHNLHEVRPGLEVIETSARTGQGMAAWLEALERRRALRPAAAS